MCIVGKVKPGGKPDEMSLLIHKLPKTKTIGSTLYPESEQHFRNGMPNSSLPMEPPMLYTNDSQEIQKRSNILTFLSDPVVHRYLSGLRKRASQSLHGELIDVNPSDTAHGTQHTAEGQFIPAHKEKSDVLGNTDAQNMVGAQLFENMHGKLGAKTIISSIQTNMFCRDYETSVNCKLQWTFVGSNNIVQLSFANFDSKPFLVVTKFINRATCQPFFFLNGE